MLEYHGKGVQKNVLKARINSFPTWSGMGGPLPGQEPCPSSGDLPNPGMETRPPILQVDSLPAETPRKPKNTGVGSLSLLQRVFPTQESNQGLLHCRQILYGTLIPSAQRLVWAAKQALGNAALGALFA